LAADVPAPLAEPAQQAHFRLAPTPSGFLHLGNAFNFMLIARLCAKAEGGLRLRIDDLDTDRVRPAYVQDVFDCLQYLGISPTDGPQTPEEHALHNRQELRLPTYGQLLNRLIATGQVFACRCSRSQLPANAPYVETCMHAKIPLDEPYVAWRLYTPKAALVEVGQAGAIHLYDAIRHPIIRRRDGLPAYHIASLSDDLTYGTTHIVRGQDLMPSTALHLYLAQLLGEDDFLRIHFTHHPLLATEKGSKLSKSAGSLSIKAMREAGVPAAALWEDFEAWANECGDL